MDKISLYLGIMRKEDTDEGNGFQSQKKNLDVH